MEEADIATFTYGDLLRYRNADYNVKTICLIPI